MGLKPEELAAVHECLTWLRQPGSNPLCFYGETGGDGGVKLRQTAAAPSVERRKTLPQVTSWKISTGTARS